MAAALRGQRFSSGSITLVWFSELHYSGLVPIALRIGAPLLWSASCRADRSSIALVWFLSPCGSELHYSGLRIGAPLLWSGSCRRADRSAVTLVWFLSPCGSELRYSGLVPVDCGPKLRSF
ncbi:hypothetical protein CRUP_025805 [Coryphaenoides rupestris]|nr:hypothetical protein CRUP_025805 [Coryphaenoides rupestris]